MASTQPASMHQAPTYQHSQKKTEPSYYHNQLAPIRLPSSTYASTLATFTDAELPRWTKSYNSIPKTPNTLKDIFRIPFSSELTYKWAFTRPLPHEALTEQAFKNVAVESSTIFRLEDMDDIFGDVKVHPCLSNHWVLIPTETVAHFTMGLVYLDIKYQREMTPDRVLPVQRGRFIVDERTGESFITGWQDNLMVVGWIGSVLGCEKIRELLMYKAPEQGKHPTPNQLLVQNSFFERRCCRVCADPHQDEITQKPCSLVDPKSESTFTLEQFYNRKKPALVRRMRGSFFGICIKSRLVGNTWIQDITMPIFVDLKHTLYKEKSILKARLRLNVDFSYPDSTIACTNRLFGVHPTASRSVIYFYNTEAPVISDVVEIESVDVDSDSSGKKRAKDKDSPTSSSRGENSDPGNPNVRTRRRIDDSQIKTEREWRRRIINRRSAIKSNAIRKRKHLETQRELKELKEKVVGLREQEEQLLLLNQDLKQLTML